MRTNNSMVRKRLFIIFITALFVFTTLLGRLAFVQLFQGTSLSQKAQALRNREIPFGAKRGKILDRHGTTLTYNIATPSVMAIPAQLKNPEQTANQLAKVLQAPVEEVYKKITRKQMINDIRPWGRRLSEEKVKAIQKLRLPGIFLTEDSKRYYPYGNLGAHFLGFTGIDNQGLAGLELIYDERLQGSRGSISFASNARGEYLSGGFDTFKAPHDGLDLVLTIDHTIQTVIERELDQAMAQYQPENILAIAMDPKTGEILGISSRPTFRPDEYQTVDPMIYNRNLPIWKTYEPGSTFKIITLAAAIEEKKLDLKEGFSDPGFVVVGGARLRCWKAGGHGHQSYLEVVQNSCNPGFVNLGNRLGKKTLFSYIKNFGFGEKTGIDLNGEATGIMFRDSQIGPVELATTAFGQGVSVTPIQQVVAVAAAINGGNLMRSHLAKGWRNPETGKMVEEVKPQLKRKVISEETSRTVRFALESVVAQGTGRKAFVDGYRIGGKTGTAQKVGPDGRYMADNHIVSFIGFAPADDPKIVVYAAVDNPRGIQFGGVVAAPIVGNIMDDSLRYMKVARRKGQILPKDTPLTIPIVEIPNLLGQEIDKIKASLFTFPVKAYGTGKRVVDQSPRPGQRVKKGTEIKLYLGS